MIPRFRKAWFMVLDLYARFLGSASISMYELFDACKFGLIFMIFFRPLLSCKANLQTSFIISVYINPHNHILSKFLWYWGGPKISWCEVPIIAFCDHFILNPSFLSLLLLEWPVCELISPYLLLRNLLGLFFLSLHSQPGSFYFSFWRNYSISP